jgi:hypothetical protein
MITRIVEGSIAPIEAKNLVNFTEVMEARHDSPKWETAVMTSSNTELQGMLDPQNESPSMINLSLDQMCEIGKKFLRENGHAIADTKIVLDSVYKLQLLTRELPIHSAAEAQTLLADIKAQVTI